MSMDLARLRASALAPIILLFPAVLASPTMAGDHRYQKLVPVYGQPVAAPLVYAQAPTTTYVAQAPVATTYVAQAPMATYVIQAQTTAPVTTLATTGQASVGNAPAMVAGGRIKAVDREDIVEELRKESKDAGSDGTRRERRKTLRDSAKTKFAEAVGGEVEGLNESELQDIENIVGAIMDGGSTTASAQLSSTADPAKTATYGYSTPSVGYAPLLIPTGTYAPGHPKVQLYQPVVPVQFWVPVQPKHHLFRH